MAKAPISSSNSASSSSSMGAKGSSAVNFLKQSYMNLPPATRGLVTVVGLGVGLYIVYKIYESVSETLSGQLSADKANAQEDRGWASEVDKLNQNPATKATISKAQALSHANSLFTAMDGYGTDEESIYSVFRNIKNDADFAMIMNAYGSRELSSGAWNPEPNLKATLSGALTSELSSDEKNALNKILGDKKIKYRV